MAKTGRPSPGLDDYVYWQERLAGRGASGLSIDEFCVDDATPRQAGCADLRHLRTRVNGQSTYRVKYSPQVDSFKVSAASRISSSVNRFLGAAIHHCHALR